MIKSFKQFCICKKTIVISLLLIVFASSNAQNDDRAQLLLRSADNQIKVMDYNAALENVNEVLKLSPDNIEAISKKTNIYLLMDNDNDAFRTADESIKNYPNVLELYLLRGIVNLTKRKDVKAIEDFDYIISNSSNKEILAKASLNRGMAHFSLQEYERAIEDLTTSIEFENKNAAVYHSRGMVYYEMKEYELAITDFKKSIEMVADNAITYYNLGMAYYRMEDFDNACLNFNKSCSFRNRNACKMVLMECAEEINFPD